MTQAYYFGVETQLNGGVMSPFVFHQLPLLKHPLQLWLEIQLSGKAHEVSGYTAMDCNHALMLMCGNYNDGEVVSAVIIVCLPSGCHRLLDWILHFGRPPQFKLDVKIIQVCWDALTASWTDGRARPEVVFCLGLVHDVTQQVIMWCRTSHKLTPYNYTWSLWMKLEYKLVDANRVCPDVCKVRVSLLPGVQLPLVLKRDFNAYFLLYLCVLLIACWVVSSNTTGGNPGAKSIRPFPIIVLCPIWPEKKVSV